MVRMAGYSDRLSVRPGETLRVMVSATVRTYQAEVVRLVSAETARDGSGYLERHVESIPVTRHPGRVQPFRLGSYGRVPGAPALRLPESFAVQAWIMPTLPSAGSQAIVSQGEPGDDGWSLSIEPAAGLVLTLAGRRVSTGIPLAGGRWSFVAASIAGAGSSEILLAQWPTPAWPVEASKATTRAAFDRVEESPGGDVLFAARAVGSGTREHFNGRLDRPRVFGGSLSEGQLAALFAGEPPGRIDVAAADTPHDG